MPDNLYRHNIIITLFDMRAQGTLRTVRTMTTTLVKGKCD